jgi:hypothetical protein
MQDMRTPSANSAVNQARPFAWWTPRLAGPVIAAAVFRFALLAVLLARAGDAALISADTKSYLDPGRNLLLHGRFIADGVPDLFRTPGYPLFLASTSLAGLPLTAFIQILLSVFSVVLVWKLARTVFDDGRIALAAAWFLAFEPITIACSVLLISETLFLTLFLLSMERLSVFLRYRRLRVLAVAGLWLAAATFVRPVTYYLPFALALGLLIVLARVQGLRWKAPAVLLISVLPWLAAWQIRNWVETGYAGFCSIKEDNLYFFNVPNVMAAAEGRAFSAVQDEMVGGACGRNCDEQLYLYPPYLALHPDQAGWSEGQRLAFLRTETYRILGAHAGAYFRTSLEGLLKVMLKLGSGSMAISIHRLPRQAERGHSIPGYWPSGLIRGS